jgi:hypothetical protein
VRLDPEQRRGLKLAVDKARRREERLCLPILRDLYGVDEAERMAYEEEQRQRGGRPRRPVT